MEKKVRTIILHKQTDGQPIECPITMEIGPNTDWEGASVCWFDENSNKICYDVKETFAEINQKRQVHNCIYTQSCSFASTPNCPNVVVGCVLGTFS